MKTNILQTALFVLLLTSFFVKAQDDNILFTIDDVPVYASEFKQVYNKNIDLVKDDSQKDVDNYLDLFVKYKLKIAEAKTLGLDKKAAYLKEFGNYKKQLAKKYLNDNKVTDALIEEAYLRLKQEVDANHILVKVAANASPKDTLLAYQEIQKLREKVLASSFEVIKKEDHNGSSIFAESLGYFTVFKMVYSFETKAYNTEVGSWSEPFRTEFGYHIVYVNDKRKNKGEVTVSHIMLADSKNDSQTNNNRISEIYKRLNQGEDFSALAKQYSDDKSSSSKGGALKPFSSGQLSSTVFEEQAFALKKQNDISKPFKTKFGHHIIKLSSKKPIKSFDEHKLALRHQIKSDSRSKVVSEKYLEDLIKKYDIGSTPNLGPVAALLNDSFFKNTWTVPSDFKGDDILFKIKNREVKSIDFAKFLQKKQKAFKEKKPLSNVVNKYYNVFLRNQLEGYQEAHLENENKDYAQILSEYRDGLLLFDLMEAEIWNTAKLDTLGLQEFYANNKHKYLSDVKVKATIASSVKNKVIKKAEKLLLQNKSITAIKNKLNSDKKINISFIVDTIEANHQALPDNFPLEKGMSKIFKHNNAFSIVKITDIFPRKQKTLEQAKGAVISDFQNKKEKHWLEGLAKKYKVVINKKSLEQVKKALK